MPSAGNRVHRFVHTVSSIESGRRLDLIVGAWLGGEIGRPLSKSIVRRLIMAGAIRVDGRPLRRAGAPIAERVRLDARVDLARLADRAAPAEPLQPAVLYEDEDVIAVAKPAGVLVHPAADAARPDLFDAVRRLLARRAGNAHPAGPLPYLGLHHRLDVETSGVVLFTKRERANRPIAGQFAGGEVTKIYHAIVARPRHAVPQAWRIENRLAPGGSGRRARVREAEVGARAATDFSVIETMRHALLLEARPETGRKHQIRAHLSASDTPILGDTRYGGASRAGTCEASRVMLHAWRLSLRHPTTGESLDIACPYPPDLERLLACLRRGR